MERRRPGRPPIDPNDPDPSVSVHVRLPSKQYEATLAKATRARMNLGDWIRRALRRADEPPKAPS